MCGRARLGGKAGLLGGTYARHLHWCSSHAHPQRVKSLHAHLPSSKECQQFIGLGQSAQPGTQIVLTPPGSSDSPLYRLIHPRGHFSDPQTLKVCKTLLPHPAYLVPCFTPFSAFSFVEHSKGLLQLHALALQLVVANSQQY